MTLTFKLAQKCACVMAFTASLLSGTSIDAKAASVELFVCDHNGEGHYEVSIISDRTTSARVSYVVNGGQNPLPGPFHYYHKATQNWVAGPGFDFAYANGHGNFHDKNANTFSDCRSPLHNSSHNSGSNPVNGNGQLSDEETDGGRYNPYTGQYNNNQHTQQPNSNVNISGLSLGGVVRSGPGMNYGKIGSTFGKTPVTIVRNTGQYMNGYAWFEIIGQSGRTGYQWGGIMCSPHQYVVGIYERCN